jgi:superfamily I DNA/RNA helicase
VSTFHGWCLRLLRTYAAAIGRTPDFRLASPSQQLGLLKEAVHAWQASQGHDVGEEALSQSVSQMSAPPRTPHASGASAFVLPSGLTSSNKNSATAALCKKLQRALKDAKLLGDKASAQTTTLLMSDIGQFVSAHYAAGLRRCGLVDMGDLQSFAIELLSKPSVLQTLQRRYRHALVDEYQDTNSQQLQIVKLLCGPPSAPEPAPPPPPPAVAKAAEGGGRRETVFDLSRHQSRVGVGASAEGAGGAAPPPRAPAPPPPAPLPTPPAVLPLGITVVGDDDQSIYSFRGAQPGVFGAFESHMAHCAVVTLSQNYRSTGMIVDASKAVIRCNTGRTDKRVHTQNERGARIELCECRNAECESDWVATRLLELQASGANLAECAVLYRTHSVGNAVHKFLKERHIPCNTSAADVLHRPDVAPIIAALRCITSPADDAAFREIASKHATPKLQAATLSAISIEAAHRGSCSLFDAARALYTSSSGIRLSLGPSSSQQPVSQATPRLDGPARESLHHLLRNIDEMRDAARTLSPPELLKRLIASKLTSLSPSNPPTGAKLLADELAQYVASNAARDPGTLSGVSAAAPRHGYASQTPPSSHRGAAGSMGPPPGADARLQALRAFLEHSALSEHEDTGDGTKGSRAQRGVTLSTIHGAKGREWSAVLLVRANEETMPLTAAFDDDEGIDPETLREERRLLYVAMTRAKKKLMISHIALGDQNVPVPSSRFLKALPRECLQPTQHWDLQQPKVHESGGQFAQRGPHGGGHSSDVAAGTAGLGGLQSGSSSQTASLRPAGALGAKLAAIQRGEAAKHEKKAIASAKKAAKAAAKADAERGGAEASSSSKGSSAKKQKAGAAGGGERLPLAATDKKRPRTEVRGARAEMKAPMPRRRSCVVDDDDSDDGDVSDFFLG